MSPVTRNKVAAGVVVALLIGGGLAFWAFGSPGDGKAPGSSLELPTGTPGGVSAGDDSAQEPSRTPGSAIPAREGDQVPDEAAYERIVVLRAAGAGPTMGSDLTLEYVDKLDVVRVTGTFEDTTTTSFVLVYDNGAWKIKE
ncbi:MAG: hypothetical protein Q7V14_03615 [Coriobacteriia bacterium]|nr:hypothetical protein [Coriobacteriia bacterium]